MLNFISSIIFHTLQALATSVAVDPKYLWSVPESWTLSEAATVPVAYCTAYYALEVRGRIKPDDVVLIHSGSGAVGQAAIAIALHHGCTVFTTVGNQTVSIVFVSFVFVLCTQNLQQ